jgi:hypothetical protein
MSVQGNSGRHRGRNHHLEVGTCRSLVDLEGSESPVKAHQWRGGVTPQVAHPADEDGVVASRDGLVCLTFHMCDGAHNERSARRGTHEVVIGRELLSADLRVPLSHVGLVRSQHRNAKGG